MASVAFFHVCSVYDNVTSKVHLQEKVLAEKVVTIVAIIFCTLSLLGVIYLSLPREQRGAEWWRTPGRVLVGPNLNDIIRAVVITSFIGTLGILVRSASMFEENFPLPTKKFGSENIFCIVINVFIQYFYQSSYFWILLYGIEALMVFIQYFYQSSYFWILLYGIEALMVSNNKELPRGLKYLIGWILPGVVCGAGTLLMYRHGTSRHYSKTDVERSVLYSIFLLPIILVLVINPIVFYYTSKAAKKALIWHYGRYTASERKLIDSMQFKFILIMAFFLASWLPNVIDAVIHIGNYDNPTGKLTIWVLMSVLNPLQPVLASLVLWGPPDSRISFSSICNSSSSHYSDISVSNVNFSRSTGSESDPLISFRRPDKQ